jgi:hypothetical protein
MFNFNLQRMIQSPNVPWLWFSRFRDGSQVTFIFDTQIYATIYRTRPGKFKEAYRREFEAMLDHMERGIEREVKH